MNWNLKQARSCPRPLREPCNGGAAANPHQALHRPSGRSERPFRLTPTRAPRSSDRRVALFLIVQLRAILYRLRDMTPDRTPTEIVALSLLAQDGVAAIWQLHLSAALAYRDGQKAAATGIIEIADAAEREWLRAKAAVTGSPG
jgi:hypothetical protein